MEECRHRNDWPKWKETMQEKLNSLIKREVFEPIVQIPEKCKVCWVQMGICTKVQ